MVYLGIQRGAYDVGELVLGNEWSFDDHSGLEIIDGNNHWPDMIRINLKRKMAWRVGLQLIHWLEADDASREDNTIQVALFGRMVKEPENDTE